MLENTNTNCAAFQSERSLFTTQGTGYVRRNYSYESLTDSVFTDSNSTSATSNLVSPMFPIRDDGLSNHNEVLHQMLPTLRTNFNIPLYANYLEGTPTTSNFLVNSQADIVDLTNSYKDTQRSPSQLSEATYRKYVNESIPCSPTGEEPMERIPPSVISDFDLNEPLVNLNGAVNEKVAYKDPICNHDSYITIPYSPNPDAPNPLNNFSTLPTQFINSSLNQMAYNIANQIPYSPYMSNKDRREIFLLRLITILEAEKKKRSQPVLADGNYADLKSDVCEPLLEDSEEQYDAFKKTKKAKTSTNKKSSWPEEEFPFVCKVETCKKAFKRPEHVKRHFQSVHDLNKRYICHYEGCDKKFARSDNLKQHLKVHTKVRKT